MQQAGAGRKKGEKNPEPVGVFLERRHQLLDFAFLVDHVLTNNRIIFLDLDFVRSSALVLVSRVEMTSTGARDQTNQFTHDLAPLYLAIATEFGQHDINAALVDDTHALGGYAQTHETLLGLDPEAVMLQVRQETTTGFVVCVGNVIPSHRTLTGNLTDSRHASAL